MYSQPTVQTNIQIDYSTHTRVNGHIPTDIELIHNSSPFMYSAISIGLIVIQEERYSLLLTYSNLAVISSSVQYCNHL